MASSKRQKTGLRDSGVFLDSDSDGTTASSPRLHKGRNVLGETSGNDRAKHTSPTSSEKRKESDKVDVESVDPDKGEDPYRYICFHRPFFDVDGENWRAWSDGKAERLDRGDLARQVYKPGFEKEKAEGIVGPRTPAKEHPGHKWVIMRDAWVKFDLLSRKGKYCDPFSFGAELLSNHWHGYGMQEVVENALVEFDQAFKKKGLNEMWSVISAMGLWLNTDDNINALIDTDDADTCCELIGLLGCACLTALNAVDQEGELKPDSRFLDLPLVIAYYLELSHDLPAYGIEGKCVSWRKEAVVYFKKGKLDPEKGLFATQLRLDKLANASDYEETTDEGEDISPPPVKGNKRKREDSKNDDVDKWHWETAVKAYKKRQGKMGGHHYDITKMTRAERAATTFDGKDPLADIPAKALKENLIDLE